MEGQPRLTSMLVGPAGDHSGYLESSRILYEEDPASPKGPCRYTI